MPGKMRSALYQFSYDVMKIRGEACPKIFAFLEKTDNLLLLRFQNGAYFEGAPPKHVSNMPFSLIQPC